MELILGFLLAAFLAGKVIPEVVSDVVTTMRASKAGEWDFIDRERDRREARAAARRQAWHDLRAARNRRNGGDGTYRPGMWAYLGEVYHGTWEDLIEKRQQKRAARRAQGYDAPETVVDRVAERKVSRLRQAAGRIGRALIEPVGGSPTPATVPQQDAPTPAPVPEPTPAPAVEEPAEPPPAAEGPRVTCPECGFALVEHCNRWMHPEGAQCRWADTAHCSKCRRRVPLDRMHCEEPRRGEYVWRCDFCQALIDEVPPPTAAQTSEPAAPTGDATTTPNTQEKPMTTTADGVKFNTAVAEHDAALAHLIAQLERAQEFKTSLDAAAAAVEAMDADREQVHKTLAPLVEGLEASRFGADVVEGTSVTVDTLTAGTVAAVQEQIEAANEQNDRWIADLTASVESVRASRDALVGRFGDAAATVQDTGVDGRALEED